MGTPGEGSITGVLASSAFARLFLRGADRLAETDIIPSYQSSPVSFVSNFLIIIHGRQN
uniref:Uncharacterized protein n=1 Tax=Picea sitchensis TaxID=3332 RepID=B8LL72_PICSI|nr:unknown [Picea sitchensis]